MGVHTHGAHCKNSHAPYLQSTKLLIPLGGGQDTTILGKDTRHSVRFKSSTCAVLSLASAVSTEVLR